MVTGIGTRSIRGMSDSRGVEKRVTVYKKSLISCLKARRIQIGVSRGREGRRVLVTRRSSGSWPLQGP